MVIILLSTKMFLCQIYKDTYILWYRSGGGDFFRNMNSPCGCFPSNFVAGKLSCSVWAKKLAGTTLTFKWVTYWNAFPIEKKKVKNNCNLNSRGWFVILDSCSRFLILDPGGRFVILNFSGRFVILDPSGPCAILDPSSRFVILAPNGPCAILDPGSRFFILDRSGRFVILVSNGWFVILDPTSLFWLKVVYISTWPPATSFLNFDSGS